MASVVTEEKKENLDKLKIGEAVYSAEYDSDKNEVLVKQLIFDGWKNGRLANVHVKGASSVKMDAVDLSYGWFVTPLSALQSFKSIMETISLAAKKAEAKEIGRLADLQEKMKKQYGGN